MKKYTVHIILGIVIIVLAVVIGCKYFNKEDSSVNSNSVATSETVVTATPEPTPTVEPTAEPTEAPHEHVYTETVTTEATCETDGLKTFACECGDSYTEVITATGHDFGEYIYNEDATYEQDGTMTATCKVCETTDTQVALGSMLKEEQMQNQQTEDPMDIAARRLAERFGISIEEARAMLENGGNPVGNGGGGSTPVANPGTQQPGATDENYITPEIPSGGNGSGGSNDGPRPGETGRPDMDLGDGGNTVGDAVINP